MKFKRKHLIYAFLFFLFAVTFSAHSNTLDSLKALSLQTNDPARKIEVYNNIDEYSYNNSEKYTPEYAYKLLNEAIKVENNYAITKALRKLLMSVNREERQLSNDSVVHYFQLAEKHLTGEWKERLITEIRLRHIRSTIDWTQNEKETTAQIMKKYTNSASNDIYSQIEREYALGKSYSLMISEWEDNLQQSQYHFDNLQRLIEQLPIQFKATLFFCIYDNLFVTYSNAKERKKTLKMLESLIATLEQYKQLDFVKKDIYIDFNEYYNIYYNGLSRFPDLIGKTRAIHYLQLTKKNCTKIDVYNACQDFYSTIGDYQKAIAYADSFIIAVKDSNFTETPAAISTTYKDQSNWYAKLKDYENAYSYLVKYDELKSSLSNGNVKKMRQEMNIRYDVDQLKFEQIQLKSRNRQIAMFSLLAILTLALAWGITQRVNLKKLQRVQKKLIKSNEEVVYQSQKAQESEKMKTAFINSMCHEIRTPLNAIMGFSGLLTDESIDKESKVEFHNLIKTSTHQLTRLINDLLEVANLDSFCGNLPVDRINLNDILNESINNLIVQEKKEGIEYQLKLETEECFVNTHSTYLSLVISNILNNANKFTTSGNVIASCYHDYENQKIVIAITDTGIGIPQDKREWVFERFTKIDDFKPGNGLGLHLCRLIIDRLQGSIKIDPNYNQGTRIIITLPADK